MLVFVSDPWQPELYDRFATERHAPFRELLALIRPRAGMRLLDLGCGTGELTARLHAHLDAAATLGVDRSAAMLEAGVQLSDDARLRFRRMDVREALADLAAGDERLDLVFSHAALHWLDDHEELFARMTEALGEGGQLAVQMPFNHGHESHRVAAELAREEPFAEGLGGWVRTSPVQPPEIYASLLDRLGFAEQHVRVQVFLHHLESRDEVVDWVRGTTLTAYGARMDPDLFDRFLALYRERLLERLRDDRPYSFAFPRLLLWAQR